MPCEQLQAARIEQESALAAGLRAGGTACLCMSELLMVAEGCDVLWREVKATVGDGRGRRRRLLVLLRWARRHSILLLLLLLLRLGLTAPARHRAVTAKVTCECL